MSLYFQVVLCGDKGSAAASQRYVKTEVFEHFKETGKLKYREFATMPGQK
jgi:hypothetical protein